MTENTLSKGRGPQRTSRQDWVDAGLEILISQGVDRVKVLVLAKTLNCARSSFYWYFDNRQDLLNSLLDHWQSTNTQMIVRQAQTPAATVNMALANVFTCWVDGSLFNTRLDFAVREWARRSDRVRRALDVSDTARLDALTGMFTRYGFDPNEAAVRARIVYFTQIGYYALEVRETVQQRMERGVDYLYCMTGQPPTAAEVAYLTKIIGPRSSGMWVRRK